MELHAATSYQCDSGWVNPIFRSSFGQISPPSITVCSKTLPLFTFTTLVYAISSEPIFYFFLYKNISQTQAVEQQKFMPLFSAQRRTVRLYFVSTLGFSFSLASDFISFLRLLNLIVKLDVLQISQPALSSLSAWAASQINRRKWIIRCDY